jgi:taurine dioxygenase
MLFVSNFKENAILLGGEMWFHSDQCYFDLPVSATSLYAIELPSVGGQTLFCDCYKPYEDLPDDIKAKLVGRVVLNVYDYQSNNLYMKSTERTKGAPSAVHPVVRTHPETGRKSLFINRLMTDYTLDMDTAESTELLEYLFDHIEQGEYIYDHTWQPGDLFVWDNRCTLHARTDFDLNERRLLRRYALEGDRPV